MERQFQFRINSLDTHYMYSDLVEIVEQAGENIDTILVLKQELVVMFTWLIVVDTNRK